MDISPLPPNILNLINNEPVRTGQSISGESSGNFADILTESFKTAGKTDAIDKVNSLDLLTGENDDLSGLLIDAQKAELALQLALQIRNKVIDAYNEIIKMSV